MAPETIETFSLYIGTTQCLHQKGMDLARNKAGIKEWIDFVYESIRLYRKEVGNARMDFNKVMMANHIKQHFLDELRIA